MYNFETLIVDHRKETRGVVYDPVLATSAPNLQQSFNQADQRYRADKLGYFKHLTAHQFPVEIYDGAPVVEGLVVSDDETVKSDEVMVMFAPYNDVAPYSYASDMAAYVQKGKPSFMDIQRAQPHSWSQTIKAGSVHDVLKAEGHGMPVVTLFSPVYAKAFEDRKALKKGYYIGADEFVIEALQRVQDIFHGARSGTQISKVHTQGSSLGASHAVGAARGLLNVDDYQPMTVGAQELILGPSGLIDLLMKFGLKGSVGEPSDETISENSPRIIDPLVRIETDAHGNEIKMFPQIGRAVLKQIPNLQGLTRSEPIVVSLQSLADNGVSVTVSLARNSGITQDTWASLPEALRTHDHIHRLTFKGVNGEKAEHIVNENVPATTIATLKSVGSRR